MRLHTRLLQGEDVILFKTSRETLGPFLTKELLAADGCWRIIIVFFENVATDMFPMLHQLPFLGISVQH